MPIKAKYNGSYKDITDLMNVDESIDYVLAKTSSSYKRVYTATRSIEDAPPTTFKSIKSDANLTDYRIYGNTSKNILPLSKTPKTETIGDILCEYDGKGTFTFTSNVDNPTYTQDQWFWVPFEEDFDFPVSISDGGHGCIQLNNDFATEYGVTPYFVGFANRDNGEFVSGFNVAGTAPNIIDTNYEVEDLEGLPANCIAFLYLHQIGKRTVTIKPALYLDIRTQQPFEPYGESVGDRTENLFDIKTFAETCSKLSATVNYTNNTLTFTATGTDAYVNGALSTGVVVPLHYRPSCIDVLPSTTYTISMSIAPKCFISWIDTSFNVVSNYTTIPTNATSYTFTTPENCTKLLIRLGKEVENIGDTFVISSIMLNAGSTPLPYEPYGYKVPMTVEGKNLAPNADWVEGYITGTGGIVKPSPSNQEITSPFVKVIPGKTYAFSYYPNKGEPWRAVCYYAEDKRFIKRQSAAYSASSVVFTVESGVGYVRFSYRSYGDGTFSQLELGDTATDYEPYHAPITTPIYLPEPIKMVGDEAEYIDYAEQKQHRVRKNLFNETLYNKNVEDNTLIYIPIYVGNVNYVTCSTTCPKTISSEYNTNNSRYIFILSGNVNTGAQNAANGVSNDAPRTIRPSNGYVTICYRKNEGYDVRPWEYQTMLNVGSTPLPYEPYIENTEVDVTLPALPTLPGTNVLSVGTEVQPSKIDITGHIKTISGGS